MIRSGLKCKDMVHGIDELMDKAMAQAFSISSTEFMDVEDFMLYKGLMKSYKELMDVCTTMCEQMDEQSKMLEELQDDMKDLKRGYDKLQSKFDNTSIVELRKTDDGKMSMKELEDACK